MVVRRAPRRAPVPAPRRGRRPARAADVAVPVDDLGPHDDAAHRPSRRRDAGSTSGSSSSRRWTALIAPLLFSYAGDAERETLRASDLDPAALYPATTVYERLAEAGRALGCRPARGDHGHDLQPGDAARRGGRHPFEQRRRMGRRDGRGAPRPRPGVRLRLRRRRRLGRATSYGPASDAHVAAATGVLDALADARPGPSGGRRDAPARDRRPRPGAGRPRDDRVRERALARDRDPPAPRPGRPAAGAGRIRPRPLPPRAARARRRRGRRTSGGSSASGRRCGRPRSSSHRASSARRARGSASGSATSSSSRARARRVWWREPGRFDMQFHGHHGGLSPEEMLIPLAALPLG